VTPIDSAPASRIESLVKQVRLVTRVSVELSSVADIDDVHSVLISGLISPLGLGYSRALLFEVAPGGRELVGKFAIGFRSLEEREELRRELEAEAAFIEKRRTALHARIGEARTGDDQRASDELRTLELGSQWVTVFQRLGTDSHESAMIERLHYVFEDLDTPSPLFPLFVMARTLLGPRLFNLAREPFRVPAELADILPNEFALVPLRTKNGLRALIFLDKHLTGEPLTDDDAETLDWFATQGALALQNAELISDLEKAYGELKAVDQLKSNFLSIISHELRTPLTAIGGFVDLIVNGKVGPVSETHRSLLTRVAKNTGHLSNMVNDLIEIAEIKAEGISDVALIAVDPLETLFSTLPKLEYRRRDKHVQIEPIFHGTIPSILCDSRALERIYFHLLDNAVKFSPADATVVIEFERRSDQTVAIAIRDKGEGIPPDKLQKIFDEFYQVDNSLTRAHEGLGLGLAVTRILVQATRGEIKVSSEIGAGSCFTLIYPIATPSR
jgi:signal transduction histidine kinase